MPVKTHAPRISGRESRLRATKFGTEEDAGADDGAGYHGYGVDQTKLAGQFRHGL